MKWLCEPKRYIIQKKLCALSVQVKTIIKIKHKKINTKK